MQLLTHSRQDSFKTCRKKHYFAYELGIRRETDAKALRMGSAHHLGIEQLALGESLETAVASIHEHYADKPEHIDQQEWDIECETVIRIACAYQWRWQDDRLEYLAAEQDFRLPLINPKTGKASRLFDKAGKIDGIVRMEDGRLAVKESKLLGDDIGPDSDLWRRLRIDSQISMYVDAARQIGYDVETVLYDVSRKPTIKANPVPCVDELGLKIVLDKDGKRALTAKGLPRQTASTADGYVMQTRPMTTEEWGEKLTNDIVERPDFYFARVEIPRLDQDLVEYQEELWDIAKTLREAQNENRWYRTVNRNTCPFCDVFHLCTSGYREGDVIPEGFEQVTNKHPELTELLGPSTDSPEETWKACGNVRY